MKSQINSILDYINWRGDLSFDISPFNDVDALILTQLSYLDFGNLIKEKLTLKEVSQKFKNSSDFERRKNLGLLINSFTVNLLFECATFERFNSIELCNYKSTYDLKNEEQFSAVTFLFDCANKKNVFVAFRGTDDTLVGWKEDFNLAFMDEVPAQKDASEYLNATFSKYSSKKMNFYIGGHSKGGNLAIYASSNMEKTSKMKISAIYNFDGPGFSLETLNSSNFKSIEYLVKSFYPQFSIIGMLFHHFDEFQVVKSNEKSIMQHDPFSWAVSAKSFEFEENLEKGSEYFCKTFNNWFEKLTEEKRIEFVETFFKILESPNVKNLNELSEHLHKNIATIIKSFIDLDSDVKKSTFNTAGDFIKEALNGIKREKLLG